MKIHELLTEKCWDGYEKKGMKTMFGKRVPNCVKKEDIDPEGPEVTIGDYTTTHFFMCGSAIKTAEKHTDKPGMERLIRLQDMIYKLEKTVMDTGESTDEAKEFAYTLHGAIMSQAKEIGIEEEVADYQQEHLNSIVKGDPKPGFGRVDLNERLVKLDKKGPKNLKKMDKKSKYEKRKAMLDQPDDINEGPNDPAIFKAVFTAGGPGAGKSFVVKNSGFQAMGFKIVNSDIAFERMLKSMGMDATPDNIYSPQGQETRDKAKELTKKRQEIFTNQGRLGLVMDGTGKDYEKIVRMSEKLKKFGYETLMVFVNTNLETALARNEKRARTLPADEVQRMWSQVQNNIGKFQRYFKGNMIIIDNSDGQNVESAITNAYNQIGDWAKTPPSNRIAQQWLSQQKA